jgi:MtN3 and saliva related transmembrane protein
LCDHDYSLPVRMFPVIDTVQVIGVLAATASVASFMPQAWKIVRTRDVEGLSAGMYLLTAAAFALWLAFGWLQGEWALIVPNALCLAAASFILAMIVMPRRQREQVATTLDPEGNR